MQVYDVRTRAPHHHAEQQSRQLQVLDDGAESPYGVACVHEARQVVEIALGNAQKLVCCAECGTLLGVAALPAA